MNKAKNVSAAVMAALIFVASLAFGGCDAGGEKGIGEKVPQGGKWYSVNKTTVGSQYIDKNDIESFESKYVGAADGFAVFYVEFQKSLPQGQDPMTADYNELQGRTLEIYGKDGSLADSVDLKSRIAESGIFKLDPKEYTELLKIIRKDADKDKTDEQVFEENGISVAWMPNKDFMIKDNVLSFSVQAVYPAKDGDSWEQKTINISYDVKTKEFKTLGENERKEQLYVQGIYDLEGYNVLIGQSFMAGSQCIFEVTLPEGKKVEYKLNSLLPNSNITYIEAMFYLGDGKILFPGEFIDSTGSYRFYEMDLNTGKCTEYLDDASWFVYDLYKARYVSGAGNVVIDEEGIKKLDFEKKCKTEYFSFSSCNINRNDTYNMSVLDIKDDCIYLTASPMMTGDLYYTGNEITYLYILSLEKENPHAGKTIIRMTSLSFFSYAFCEAVCKFNDTNRDYFIMFDDAYSVNSKINSGELSYWDEDYDAKRTKAAAELSYKLALDLANGDGPDIVFGANDYSNLNSSQYLLDLKNEIKVKGTFENVIEACEIDGKIYQYPLAFSVTGIVVPSSVAGDKQYGFNYGQYKELVKGPCNGTDPISKYRNQISYFDTCMSVMSETYRKNGGVDFDNKEFRELAEYIKDNAGDVVHSDDNLYSPVEKNSRGCVFDVGITLPHMLRFYGDSLKDIRVMGLPSGDGRGPAIQVSISIGVSAQTKNKKACVDFVKTLFSEEIQEQFGEFDSATPVNVKAYKKAGLKAVEKYNANYNKNKTMYSRQDLMSFGFAWCEVDKSAVDDYEKVIRSCSCVISEDPSLSIIVKEEMPAYLTGQKSLDDVIKIINDRAKTVVSERG